MGFGSVGCASGVCGWMGVLSCVRMHHTQMQHVSAAESELPERSITLWFDMLCCAVAVFCRWCSAGDRQDSLRTARHASSMQNRQVLQVTADEQQQFVFPDSNCTVALTHY